MLHRQNIPKNILTLLQKPKISNLSTMIRKKLKNKLLRLIIHLPKKKFEHKMKIFYQIVQYKNSKQKKEVILDFHLFNNTITIWKTKVLSLRQDRVK